MPGTTGLRVTVVALVEETLVLHLLADEATGHEDLLSTDDDNALTLEKGLGHDRGETPVEVPASINDDRLRHFCVAYRRTDWRLMQAYSRTNEWGQNYGPTDTAPLSELNPPQCRQLVPLSLLCRSKSPPGIDID